MFKINIISHVRSDYAGYDYLASIYHEVALQRDKEVVFDFGDAVWFDANLVAVLGAIISRLNSYGYEISLEHLNSTIWGVFSHNGFLSESPSRTDIPAEASVPYREFSIGDNTLFSEYIIKEVLEKENFPRHSEALEKEIARNIFELYENAIFHANSHYVHTCGQYFPNHQPTRLDFTIVDMGTTFLEKINRYMHQQGERLLDAHSAIDWAMIVRNTTKIGRTGGLGLPVIFDFLKRNKGKMQIVSDIGFWEYNNGVVSDNKYIKNKFPGAIVNIEFNFDDSCFYTVDPSKNSVDSSKNIAIGNIF